MNTKEVLLFGGLAAGGFYMWKRMQLAGAPHVTSATVYDTCMKTKPNWTGAQCRERLDGLVMAWNNHKAKIAELEAQRAIVLANGPLTGIAAIDKELSPWKYAANGFREDYHTLTGVWLQ